MTFCEKVYDLSHFNPLPRKEGDVYRKILDVRVVHFNPLPRKEGDTEGNVVHYGYIISIHSLVKRETA